MSDCLRWGPISIAIVLFLLALPLHAQDEETSSNQLMFIPPPVEGVISLGVYDSKGKLVRVLKKAASIDSFKSGLNGLFIDWDRNDSQGKPVPSGKYFAKGVLVRDVKIAGVAFHLNDWIVDANSPRPRRILSVALLPDARPALLSETTKQEYLIVEDGRERIKSVPLDFNAQSIKPAGANLLVFDSSKLAL